MRLLSANKYLAHAGQHPPAVKFSTRWVPCGQSFSSSIGKQSTNLQFGQTATWKVGFQQSWCRPRVWFSLFCMWATLHSTLAQRQNGEKNLLRSLDKTLSTLGAFPDNTMCLTYVFKFSLNFHPVFIIYASPHPETTQSNHTHLLLAVRPPSLTWYFGCHRYTGIQSIVLL